VVSSLDPNHHRQAEFLPGWLPLPIVDADGALADLALALREYADDWEDRLGFALNRSSNRGLVQLMKLSSDEQLVELLERGGE